MSKINCCYLNTTLQKIQQEEIRGKKYFNLGYITTFYFLFKNMKDKGFLCGKCVGFSKELSEIYWNFEREYQKIYEG